MRTQIYTCYFHSKVIRKWNLMQAISNCYNYYLSATKIQILDINTLRWCYCRGICEISFCVCVFVQYLLKQGKVLNFLGFTHTISLITESDTSLDSKLLMVFQKSFSIYCSNIYGQKQNILERSAGSRKFAYNF